MIFYFYAHKSKDVGALVHEDGVVVGPFDVAAAATAIVIAAAIGYCVGFILSTVWNKVHRA